MTCQLVVFLRRAQRLGLARMLGLGNRRILVLASRRLINGFRFRALGLIGDILELGLREDQLDHLALDDLIAQRIHQPPLFQTRPNASRAFVALGRQQLDLGRVIIGLGFELLVLGNPLQNEVFLERRAVNAALFWRSSFS